MSEAAARPTVILDRDGTLNREQSFVCRPEDLVVLDGVRDALARLDAAGYQLVVVTNQSGVARGLYDEATLARIHARLHAELDGLPRAYLHCPHHPDFSGPCGCRKPAPGMLLAAAGSLNLDLRRSVMVGDKIVTRDNGIQEIRWVGAKALSYGELAASEHLRPILITRGSLGKDLPERDMMVSPNHRVLVANERTALYFEEHEVLVAAKHLVDNHRIRDVQSLGTTYIHFMFDRHEVVLANGCWTESFQPGDYSLNGLGNAQRGEIYELFPELKTGEGRQKYTAARKTLKRHEAKLLRFRG